MATSKATLLVGFALCAAAIAGGLAAGSQQEKYVIDRCKAIDEQKQGGAFEYSVTIYEPSRYAHIATTLQGATEADKSEQQVPTSPGTTTYRIKFDVPAAFATGTAKLITKLDAEKVRECSVRITKGSDPPVTGPSNPFVQATLSGTVTDGLGAVLPGVTVTVRNTETRATRTATTDSAGRYAVAGLPPGKYLIEATVPGFMSQRKEVDLNPGASVSSDFTFKIQG
jgi:hypothetical protein